MIESQRINDGDDKGCYMVFNHIDGDFLTILKMSNDGDGEKTKF